MLASRRSRTALHARSRPEGRRPARRRGGAVRAGAGALAAGRAVGGPRSRARRAAATPKLRSPRGSTASRRTTIRAICTARASSCSQRGEPERALAEFARANSIEPPSSMIEARIANMARLMGLPDQQILHLRAAIELEPDAAKPPHAARVVARYLRRPEAAQPRGRRRAGRGARRRDGAPRRQCARRARRRAGVRRSLRRRRARRRRGGRSGLAGERHPARRRDPRAPRALPKRAPLRGD